MTTADIKKNIIKDLKFAGIYSGEIDAQILLEFVTGKSREFLLAHPEYELSPLQIRRLNFLIFRRQQHEPIAYITGHKEFFGLDFFVTPDVLIPRPETEMIVEETIQHLKTKELKNEKIFRILDVGTGSGNIIISIAKQCRLLTIVNNLHLSASDISGEAIKVARKNAEKHGVEKLIKFYQSDLFENLHTKYYDIILANLPYIPSKKCNRFDAIASNRLHPEEVDFEPKAAIFAEDNGTAVIKKFLQQAKNHINKNGLILVEVDPRNASQLKNYASKLYRSVKLKKDFSGIYRVLKILT